jgi:hypothetical protein
MKESMRIVAKHRDVPHSPLKSVLEGYEAIAQPRWLAWLRKQRLETAIPNVFSEVLRTVEIFSDPVISGAAIQSWNPATRQWN